MPRLHLPVVLLLLCALISPLAGGTPVLASSITPVSNTDAGALTLAQSMIADPGTLVSARFTAIPPTGTPHGIANSLSFFPTSGATFGILTTGSATFADAPNNSPDAGTDLNGLNVPERGSTAWDVTTLAIDLRAPTGANCMQIDFAFYSEEFPEYIGTPFNDTFIAELNSSTWTANSTITAANNFAFDLLGDVVSVNSTGATSMNELNATGTTYDGATALLQAATPISTQANTLYLSVFDQGDNLFDSAAFVDNIRFATVANPARDCRPGAQEKRVPVILLPGVGGSKLVNDNGEQWPRVQETFTDEDGDLFLRSLRLDPDGQSPFDPNDPTYTTMRVGDIVRVEPLFVGGADFSRDIYGTTIEAFHDAGYKEGLTLFPFPYDWRKDAALESGRLLTFIDHVRQQTGAARVDILAHSMGGLVARATLANPNSVGKIRKVLTLGTPVLGAARALGILEYQQPCFIDLPPYVVWKPACLIDPATLQELLTNFPGAYELLPSRAYDQAINEPLTITRDTNGDGQIEGVQSYPEWSAMVSAHRNAGLVTNADTFHQTYDNLTLADPSVQYSRVIGDGLNTIRQIREHCITMRPWQCKVAYELVQGPGDETVPRHSADLYNPTKGFDWRNGVTNAYAHKVEHGVLATNRAVLNYALSYFGATPSTNQAAPASLASSSESGQEAMSDAESTVRQEHNPWTERDQVPLAVQAEAQLPETTISDTPQPFGGIELETVGPVRGGVTDLAGNYTGHMPNTTSKMIEVGIPLSSYNAIADTQSFFMNAEGTYTATLTTTAAELVRLRVRTYANDQMDGQAVFNVDVPTGATIDLTFTTHQDLDSLRLRIDRDGDGSVDAEVAPDSTVVGAAASDMVPPTTTAVVQPVNSQQASISLTAQDQPGGSGVAATYYEVDGVSSQVTPYTGPIVVPFGAVVHFLSVDRAGNTEAPQEVTPSPTQSTVTFAADADARVEQDSPTSNYGTSGTLRIEASDPGDDEAVESYVRFTVAGLQGPVQQATLRLYATTNGTTVGSAVYQVTGAWTETGITWNTRPSRAATPIATSGGVSAGSWVEYDVTSLVTGNGSFSFALVAPSDDGISFSAREGTALPELVITAAAASLPNPRSFGADADGRVEASSATTNYGASNILKVDTSPAIESYLRFTVAGVTGTVQNATLRLYVGSNGTTNGPAVSTTDASWAETALTWNTRPARGSTIVANVGTIGTNRWVEYDVTAVVTGDGTYGFALIGESSDDVTFEARQGNNRPQLVLTLATTP